MTRDGSASGKQGILSWAKPGDETVTGKREGDTPVEVPQVMERVLERGNLFRALRQVTRNKGGPGIDGMTVEQLPGYLKEHWPHIKAELLSGKYKPQPVKRVEIPKSGGGIRKLGVPTVTDRLIQQALMQVLREEWDTTFSQSSYGFRPRRSAHQAGVSVKGVVEPTREGAPQGGPLSPLLANLLLDELDKEMGAGDIDSSVTPMTATYTSGVSGQVFGSWRVLLAFLHVD